VVAGASRQRFFSVRLLRCLAGRESREQLVLLSNGRDVLLSWFIRAWLRQGRNTLRLLSHTPLQATLHFR
jgi:hypothetical protein